MYIICHFGWSASGGWLFMKIKNQYKKSKSKAVFTRKFIYYTKISIKSFPNLQFVGKSIKIASLSF